MKTNEKIEDFLKELNTEIDVLNFVDIDNIDRMVRRKDQTATIRKEAIFKQEKILINRGGFSSPHLK